LGVSLPGDGPSGVRFTVGVRFSGGILGLNSGSVWREAEEEEGFSHGRAPPRFQKRGRDVSRSSARGVRRRHHRVRPMGLELSSQDAWRSRC
jgi:hypothetical protein